MSPLPYLYGEGLRVLDPGPKADRDSPHREVSRAGRPQRERDAGRRARLSVPDGARGAHRAILDDEVAALRAAHGGATRGLHDDLQGERLVRCHRVAVDARADALTTRGLADEERGEGEERGEPVRGGLQILTLLSFW